MSELKIIEKLVDDLVTRVEALEEKAEEIWVPVKDNWAYFISNRGRVKTYTDFYPKITVRRDGYCYVYLKQKSFLLHKLLAQAFIPNPENKPEVDHIDGDKLNNSLSNLRWATRAENTWNRGKQRNNTSDYTGVTFRKDLGKYQARIMINYKSMSLGCFHTKEEAAAVYQEAARKEFGEFYKAP